MLHFSLAQALRLDFALQPMTARASSKKPLDPGRAGDSLQLSLSLLMPGDSPKLPAKKPGPKLERFALLDQRMSTAEVLRIVGVHRVTLFRWTRKGTFPPKHSSGGWLRSDIEHWLSCRTNGILPFSVCDRSRLNGAS